jgi:hypothetical protein
VEELELTTSADLLQDTLERTLNQLQKSTAGLSVTGASVDGGSLVLQLRVDNMAGHKLPTGYPARQLWLHVTVAGESGQILFESGRPHPDGSISGNNADEDAADFEPHYDTISSVDQVQIYEAVMRDADGQVTNTLLKAMAYAKDNRLIPAGFDPTTAAEEISVHGLASLDDDFVGGSDRLTYEIDISETSGPLTVSAELLYHALSYRFVEDLMLDPTDAVSRFAELYREADKAPVVLATAKRVIE